MVSRAWRKPAAVVVVLVLCLAIAPASAKGRRRVITETYTARALPYPDMTPGAVPPAKGSCQYQTYIGEDPRRWFKAPGSGTLTVRMDGFAGDWDLYLLDGIFRLIVGSTQNQITEGAPANEELVLGMTRGQAVYIAPCNWLGQPEVEVTYEYVYFSKR